MIKRQKIQERDQFSFEEKEHIAAKSDHNCCHCGKKVFYGYGATVEHFIPLSQGGTNRDINLIMLCEECNKSKGKFIYHPDYLKYLKEDEKEKLEGYFNSYIHSFEFLNRNNLLACDKYFITVETVRISTKFRRSVRNKNVIPHQDCTINRLLTDEAKEKVIEYYIKYLKKYKMLDSEEKARLDIEFWMKFGCIYYIERNGEIKTFVACMVTKTNGRLYTTETHDDTPYFLSIFVFSYYDNDYSLTLSYNLSRCIGRSIMDEQGIEQIPVAYYIIKGDHLAHYIVGEGYDFNFPNMYAAMYVEHDGPMPEDGVIPRVIDDEKLMDFFKKFSDINDSGIEKWLDEHGITKKQEKEWFYNQLELPKLSAKETREKIISNCHNKL